MLNVTFVNGVVMSRRNMMTELATTAPSKAVPLVLWMSEVGAAAVPASAPWRTWRKRTSAGCAVSSMTMRSVEGSRSAMVDMPDEERELEVIVFVPVAGSRELT
jgi:hypothetical protein